MHGYARNARLARHPVHVPVGDLLTLSGIAVVAPAVERAADAVAFDAPADADVRAEVRAVGVDHVRRAVLTAEQDDVPAEDVERTHLARRQVTRLRHDEPAVRDGKRETAFARRAAYDRAAAAIHQRLRVLRHREPAERLVAVLADRHGCSWVLRRLRGRVATACRRALRRASGRCVRQAAAAHRCRRRTPRPR